MMAILTCYCVPVYMILCHNSHSHLVLLYSSVSNGHSHLVCVVFQCTWYSVMTAILTLCVLYSSVPDTVSRRPFSPCVCCIPVYLIQWHDGHSHLVCVVFQCTWYCVMTAILTLCVLYSSVPDTVAWRPFSPCVCCIPAYLILCHDGHSHLVCVVFQRTWYCVMTAILTLCVLCPRTQCWRRSTEMSFTSTPRNSHAALWHPSEHTVFTLCVQTIKFCFCGECSPFVLIITAVMHYGECNFPVWLSVMHCTDQCD